MSCHKCDNEPIETYVRVGPANILIVGCRAHIGELLNIFAEGRKALKER